MFWYKNGVHLKITVCYNYIFSKFHKQFMYVFIFRLNNSRLSGILYNIALDWNANGYLSKKCHLENAKILKRYLNYCLIVFLNNKLLLLNVSVTSLIQYGYRSIYI